MRKVPRSVHEAGRDKARAIAKTEAYVVSCRIDRLDRLRLRGPIGERDEFLFAPTAGARAGRSSALIENPALL
jgi:hypothetical protein